MRRLSICLSILLMVLLAGCGSKSYLPKDAEFDDRFTGIWRGELPVEGSERVRRWKKKRRQDGGLVINMGLYEGDGTYLGREIISGFWWVKENFYFEKLPSLEHMVVTHAFVMQEDGTVKFTVQTLDTDSQDSYSFTEKKIGEVK